MSIYNDHSVVLMNQGLGIFFEVITFYKNTLYYQHKSVYEAFEKKTRLCERFTKFVCKYKMMTDNNLIVPCEGAPEEARQIEKSEDKSRQEKREQRAKAAEESQASPENSEETSEESNEENTSEITVIENT